MQAEEIVCRQCGGPAQDGNCSPMYESLQICADCGELRYSIRHLRVGQRIVHPLPRAGIGTTMRIVKVRRGAYCLTIHNTDGTQRPRSRWATFLQELYADVAQTIARGTLPATSGKSWA